MSELVLAEAFPLLAGIALAVCGLLGILITRP